MTDDEPDRLTIEDVPEGVIPWEFFAKHAGWTPPVATGSTPPEPCAICGWTGPRTQYLGDAEGQVAVAHPDGDHLPDWLPRLRATAPPIPLIQGDPTTGRSNEWTRLWELLIAHNEAYRREHGFVANQSSRADVLWAAGYREPRRMTVWEVDQAWIAAHKAPLGTSIAHEFARALGVEVLP